MLFCPECGKALAPDRVEPAGAAQHESHQVAASAIADSPASPTEPAISADKNPGPADQERLTARERTRETLQRASQKTRGAIEGNVKRVEKIHQVSTVMLEEATYDPSLRFVLVALGLFVLFVVLLVLSKVMG